MESLITDRLKEKVKAALARAAWTFGVTVLPALGVGAATDLAYLSAINIAGGAAILSFVKSMVVGMPETTYATVVPYTGDIE